MRFKVMLRGRGISLHVEASPDPAIGFFTTRWVTADDVDAAASVAVERVLSEWRPGGAYASGGIPNVAVESVDALGWWARLFAGSSGSGYSFYLYED